MANTASADSTASNLPKISCFTAISSNAASIANCAVAAWLYCVLSVNRLRRSAARAASIIPRVKLASMILPILSSARFKPAASASRIVTCKPDDKSAYAIPAPIVPPPTTAACSTSNAAPFKCAGAFAARCAKNRCRRALDCDPVFSSKNTRRSYAKAA